jgi:acyl-coenzyme A synthetase/AMP-(fatty) acid ligase
VNAGPPFPNPRIPEVFAEGRWWSPAEVDRLARPWRSAGRTALESGSRYLATVLPSTSEGVAIFVALTSLPVPVIVLNPNPEMWRGLRLPPGTSLMLPPSVAPALAAPARTLAPTVTALSSDASESDEPVGAVLQSPGVVLFTSGSTGAPKPVFRPLSRIVAAGLARLRALGVGHAEGIAASTSLAHGRGVTCLSTSLATGAPLGLVPSVNHRAALHMLARPEFGCWWASAHLADLLGRCLLTAPAKVPRICLLSSAISQSVFQRFVQRFGVPLRQTYSSSETGCLTVDARPDGEVHTGTVGLPVPGVALRIGEHPDRPSPQGSIDRIWARSPWAMAGYGFPPDLEPRHTVNGWWPTQDLGSFDAGGRLTLNGRLDDCIRTREGQLVNLAEVGRLLRELSDVHEAAVVPIEGQAGTSFGAVVECAPSLTPDALRMRISDALPSWALPRRLAVVDAMPRLPSGRTDRRQCQSVLESGAVT